MKLKKMELLVLLLVTALIAGTANADITTGLVGHWAFDDGVGPTAVDSSPNGYDGTLVGTPTWDSGPEGFGGALLFDVRSLDGIQGVPECNPGSVFTLSIWAYWLDSTYEGAQIQHFMTKSDGWASDTMMWQWELHANAVDPDVTDKILISYTAGGATLSSSTMPANEWVHLTVTFDGTDAQLFINGIADAIGPVPFSVGTKTDAGFYIGKSNYLGGTVTRVRSFDGYLDEARVYNRVLSQADIQELLATDKAVNIEPKNGELLAAVDTDLVWDKPTMFTPSKYDLYYKVGDPNFATGATIVNDIAHVDPCNVYDTPADFANDTTIYWRVDSYWPGASDPCMGNLWHFTTVTAEPVVTKDPVSLTVAAGGTAVFTVEDVGGTGYVWKKQSTGLTVGTGSVLTLTDVQKDPCEDSYYCIVSNASGSAPPSAAATLWTKRLVAHWDFDGNLSDSVGDWPGVYTDPNEYNPQPPTAVYGSGLDGGQALQLANDPCHVQITGSEDFFNFYPLGYSANVWTKSVQSGWGALACKQSKDDDLGWTVYCGSGNIWNGLRGVASVYNDNAGVSDNQWYMVTITYDAEAGVLTTYVDGESVGSDTSTAVALTNIYPVLLGAERTNGLGDCYEGLLDSVGIYSYALRPLEVAVLYTDVMTDAEICLEQPENDLSGDCRVGLEDFAILATNWLECNLVPASACP